MQHWLVEVFGGEAPIGPLQECARAVLIFAYGLAIFRLAGRRAFAKWSALDIIISIIVGSNLSRALTGGAPLFGTLLATALLMALHWLLAHAAARLPALSRILEGHAVTLAKDGMLNVKAMHSHGVTEADLNEALRRSGTELVAETKKVTLEPSGAINVLKGK